MNDVTARPNSLPWPPIIFLAAIAVSVSLNAFYPLPWFAQPLSGILSAIGWLMIAAFVALNISAVRAMRCAGTTVRPDRGTDRLVTEGPFCFTRNLLYLARHDTCTGDWTGLRDRMVFAACRPRCLRGAKARHREGGKASPGAIREDLCGLRRACAAVDLGSYVAPLRFL
jgi:hypothetical protein